MDQYHHKEALVSIITAELGLEFASERRFYDRRDLESIVSFIITNLMIYVFAVRQHNEWIA